MEKVLGHRASMTVYCHNVNVQGDTIVVYDTNFSSRLFLFFPNTLKRSLY